MLQTPLPGPVAIGSDYYVLRWEDYTLRHGASQPPNYYLHYGDKYCRRFRLELRQWFSPSGQAWIDKTCDLLQQMLEGKRIEDPVFFARLEENAPAFRNLAYSQHAAAYIQGGIADLPLYDLILIAVLIDPKDLLTPEGIDQVFEVLAYLIKMYVGRIFNLRKVSFLRKVTMFLEQA